MIKLNNKWYILIKGTAKDGDKVYTWGKIWVYKTPPCPIPYWGGNNETYLIAIEM